MSCGKPAIACRGQAIDEVIEYGKNRPLMLWRDSNNWCRGFPFYSARPKCGRIQGRLQRQSVTEKSTLRWAASQFNPSILNLGYGPHREGTVRSIVQVGTGDPRKHILGCRKLNAVRKEFLHLLQHLFAILSIADL